MSRALEPVGEAAHLVDEVGCLVVDAVAAIQLGQALELVVSGGCGDDARAGPLGELDRGEADATAAGTNQRRLAGLEATELEQGIVDGAERDRDTGCLLGREGGRDHPAEPLRHCS
jgi:hypothetical protein